MSNDPFGGDELPGDASDDLETIREARRQDTNLRPPAIAELAFASLTAFVAVVWFVGLFVLDVDGTTWMGLGALGLILFGGPTAIIHGLRNGGVEVIRQTVQQYLG